MGKLRNDETGFSAVEVILVLVIVALIGAVGFLVYKNHTKATTPVAKTSTNSTATKTATKPTTTTPQATIVKLPELGVQFTLPTGTLTDFKYVAANVDYSDPGNNTLGTYPTAYLGTTQLDTLGCPATGVIGNAPPLGFLTKTTGQYPTSPTADNTTGTLLKQYPDYYISYRSRGFACFDDTAKNQIVTTDNQQLQTALKTLDLIK
jgi:Tfp pilus assembly major pilin PilA